MGAPSKSKSIPLVSLHFLFRLLNTKLVKHKERLYTGDNRLLVHELFAGYSSSVEVWIGSPQRKHSNQQRWWCPQEPLPRGSIVVPFWGFPYRLQNIHHKKELLWSLP